MINRKHNAERENLTGQILDMGGEIFRTLRFSIPDEWMSAELTVSQIRVLLVLFTEGQRSMSALAATIGVTVSTATGVVDNLFKKELVLRESDPEDRRLVICHLSPAGEEQIKKMWALGRSQVEQLLGGLKMEDLHKAAEVARIFLANATHQPNIRPDQPPPVKTRK